RPPPPPRLFPYTTLFRSCLPLATYQRAKAAKLPFDTYPLRVGRLHHLPGDADIVFEVGRSLAVLAQTAVHHHAGETVVDGTLAGLGAVAMILVHDDGDVGIELRRRQHQVPQVGILRIAPGAARGLHDDGRIGLLGGLHDRLNLLHVV